MSVLASFRTAVNVAGDAVVSTIVAKTEGKLDQSVFDDPEAGLIDEHEALDNASIGTTGGVTVKIVQGVS